MPRYKLSNVTVDCLSIVKEGANRKRFFLRKEADVNEGDLLTLPARQRLLKAPDWSAVYCVVAEPGAVEQGGLGAPDVEDEWADPDEIRKAAHSLLRNGGLVTALHQSLDPYGKLVESAVALDDFTVEAETIKKGSWYVAIEPSAEGREAIEKGDFTGVSLEGHGQRTLVADAPATDKQGLWKRLGEALGFSEGSDSRNVDRKNPEEDEVDEAQKQQLADAAKDSKEALAKASAAVTAITALKDTTDQILARLPEPEKKPPTAEELDEKLTKAVEGITEIAKGIDVLAQGSSEQPHQGKQADNVRQFSLAKSDDKGPIGLLG